MRVKKAAGEIDRFPGGRKSGSAWITPRMREARLAAKTQEFRASQAQRPPTPFARRRGRPSMDELILLAKARIAELRAQLRA